MNIMSKFAIAGLFGTVVSLTPAGGALAGPVGVASPGVAPIQASIETVRYLRYGYYYERGTGRIHHHRHYYYPSSCGGGCNPYFTALSGAGVVSYPVYEIHNYMTDYSAPIYNMYDYGYGGFWR